MIEHYQLNQSGYLLLPSLLLLASLVACSSEVSMPVSHDDDLNHSDDTQSHEVSGILTMDQEALDTAGIKIEPAQGMEVPEVFETIGVISANESRLIHIRPLSGGIVREVYTQKGDRVVPDQQLLAYDNVQLGELMGELRTLQAQLRRSLAQEELSSKLLERGKELYRAEAISEKELDLRTTEHRSAEETVNSYQAEIAGTVEKLRRFGATDEQIQGTTERSDLEPEGPISLTVLKAPFSGTVIDYDVAPGEVISPDRSLLTIADLSLVWVLADIYQHDLATVAPGREVEVMTNSYPNRTFPARVTYVGDVVDAQTRTVKVRCLAENPEGVLKLGMFATVRIHKGSAWNVTVVPASAIQLIEKQSVVFVQLENNQFEQRVIRTGTEWQGWVSIEDGLHPGEPVVTEGAFSLKSELLREALGGGHGH